MKFSVAAMSSKKSGMSAAAASNTQTIDVSRHDLEQKPSPAEALPESCQTCPPDRGTAAAPRSYMLQSALAALQSSGEHVTEGVLMPSLTLLY